MNQQDRISDEEFIKRYTERTKHRSRSNKYVKEKSSVSAKGVLYYIFLAIIFIVAYYLFSTFFFPPQI